METFELTEKVGVEEGFGLQVSGFGSVVRKRVRLWVRTLTLKTPPRVIPSEARDLFRRGAQIARDDSGESLSCKSVARNPELYTHNSLLDLRHLRDDFIQDFFRSNAFGVRLQVENQTMAQARQQ
jgi:hypothetical protein